MSGHRRYPIAAAVTGLALLAACGDDGGSTRASVPSATSDTRVAAVIDPGDGGHYVPTVDPARFTAHIDNPYLPLAVGAQWRYEGTDDDGGHEVVEITVLDETRTVMGVEARVVRDRVTVDGELVEDTLDWFAQDRDGNVWYFGEDVQDYAGGEVVSTAGSWEAGVDGAQPGIVMPARPRVGAAYRQEYRAGEAEDMFEIRALAVAVATPYASFDAAVQTRDWTPLEPEVVEEKYYVAGVGKVAEEKVAGGSGEVLLVRYRPPGERAG